MSKVRRQGFTLIELLTVIAIIGVLAGLTFSVVPRFMEKAKITRVKGTFSSLNTAMLNYFAKHNSYPPAYGYRVPNSGNYFLRPYTAYDEINIYGNEDMYDDFSVSYDTDNDGQIGALEFMPIGNKNLATGQLTFPDERYNGTNLGGEVTAQRNAQPRPIVYVPVNSRQFAIAKKYWITNNDFYAESWDSGNPLLQTINFPPTTYDAFVLISVGPGGTTGGVVSPAFGSPPYDDPDAYHVAGLRTFFLATRDLNDNNVPDFEYEARAQQNEATDVYDVNGQQVSNGNLPNGEPLYGPLMFVSK